MLIFKWGKGKYEYESSFISLSVVEEGGTEFRGSLVVSGVNSHALSPQSVQFDRIAVAAALVHCIFLAILVAVVVSAVDRVGKVVFGHVVVGILESKSQVGHVSRFAELQSCEAHLLD